MIYRRNVSRRTGARNAKFNPALHEGVDLRREVRLTDDFLRTKISWMHRLPNFLTHGAPLRALRARESSAIKTASKQVCLWFAEPRGGDTQGLPRIFRLCWIPKKSLLNQATQKNTCLSFLPKKIPEEKISIIPVNWDPQYAPFPPGQAFLKSRYCVGKNTLFSDFVCINFKSGSRCRNQYPLAFPLSDERKIHKCDYPSKYSNKDGYTWSNPVTVLPCRLEQGQKSIGTPKASGCW